MPLKKLIRRGLISFILLIIILPYIIGQNVTMLPEEARACMADSIMLDAGPGWETYLWSTDETTQSIWVYITGPYEVTVTLDTISITDDVFVSLVDAEILSNDTTILCADTIMLKGSDEFYDYTWATTYTLEDILGTDDSVYVYPRDTSYIFSKIAHPAISEIYCIDSLKVDVQSIINIDTLWPEDTLVCPIYGQTSVLFEASGGFPPYSYQCSDGTIRPDQPGPTIAIEDLKEGENVLIITDTIGCLLNHNFEIEAYPLPEIELYSEPADTVYLQKPYVDFSFENVSPPDSLPYPSPLVLTGSYAWYFEAPLDTINAVFTNEVYISHTYKVTGTYDVIFESTTQTDCICTDTITIVVEPVQLAISPVITADGNNINDYFEIVEDDTSGEGGENGEGEIFKSGEAYDPIDLSKYYISNKLTVFNRYGQKVFDVENYENNWDGGGLKDGVYFYILECIGEYEDKVYKGSVTIINGS